MMVRLDDKTQKRVAREMDVYGLPADVPDLLKLAAHASRDVFNKSGGRCSPALFVAIGGGVTVMPVRLEDANDKDSLEAMMRHLASAGATAMVMVTESWVTHHKVDDPDRILLPSQDPSRDEGVTLAYQSSDTMMCAMAMIDRLGGGAKPRLLDWTVIGGPGNPKPIGRFFVAYA